MSSNDESKSPVENDASQEEPHKTRKMMVATVVFLDKSSTTFEIPWKALGKSLLDKAVKKLNLMEADYFGLEYEDEDKTKYWLDSLKPLCRQVGLITLSPTFQFCVKFYAPDPVQLGDEFTRYLFSLQIKNDLTNGCLQCNDNTAAIMISYIVQAELGDYDSEEFPDHAYLSRYKLIAFQDMDLDKKIMESHKKHVGQTSGEAESNLLETARRCELYGIRMTAAKDHEGVPLNLAVAHAGVLVFQNFTKINTFSWAKIRKLSFKRKKFLIKLHPEGYGYYKDLVEFFFERRNDCKNFWKKCIENHTFFRCSDATKGMRQKPKLFSRGSSFRYSGRTQVQLSEYIVANYVKRNFQRSTSLRTTPTSPCRPPGGSTSPQPLLPVSTSFSSDSASANHRASSPPKQSVSEPSTPHPLQNQEEEEMVTAFTNGDKSPSPEEVVIAEREASPGLTTPDSELGGYQTSDYMGQEETDDNLSHDSYQLVDKSRRDSSADGGDRRVVEGEQVPEVGHRRPQEMERSKSLDVSSCREESTSPIKRVSNGHCSLSSVCSEGSYTVEEPYIKSSSLAALSSSACSDSLSSLSEPQLLSNKKIPRDKAYYLAKELLMTERTYRKDLEIVDIMFREEFMKQKTVNNEVVESILDVVGPLYDQHCMLLRDLEQRLAFWEGKHVKIMKNSVKGVGDIMVNHKEMLKSYKTYVDQLPKLLKQLDYALKNDQGFGDFLQKFERLEACYLPLTTFLLKPLYRIAHYCNVLKAFLDYYDTSHFDYPTCDEVLKEFEEDFKDVEKKIPSLVNYVKLMELERNLTGFPPEPPQTERVFLREGSLQKLSKNDSSQCMVFLFSDLLLCTEQVASGKLAFRVRFALPVSNLMKVAKIEPRPPTANHCFTVQRGEKCLFLSAGSARERAKWLRDIANAIRNSVDEPTLSSPPTFTIENNNNNVNVEVLYRSNDRLVSHHVNTSVHVCWHRSLSVGRDDLHLALRYSLSSFLLRKFKNNNGWQKLWVVLSNLCLFFYKSNLDESPLASLPLTGYRVGLPIAEDGIAKDFAFKLQYKNYDYFFCTESKFMLDRWMDIIHVCTLAENEKTHL